MAARKLVEKRVEKVWGRRDLPDMFGGTYGGEQPLGEIWFEDPDGADLDLLIKYLFTSERLSIQVHPDDEAAARKGYRRGKDEAWIVLRAEPDATIGVGFREHLSREQLRAAALDGSIAELIDWRPAAPGDILFSPAGTVHALGAGLTLVEVQQNVDLTYRLFDYGRPRELHLDEGIEASDPAPYVNRAVSVRRPDGREIVAKGPAFTLERWSHLDGAGRLHASPARPVWLIPISGAGAVAGDPLEVGSVWLVDEEADLDIQAGSELYAAYPGDEIWEDLIS